MTLLLAYGDMRNVFTTTGTVMADGLEQWPSASLTASAWTGLSAFNASLTFPVTVTASVGADCHAYLSQRTDVVANQWLTISAANATVDSWTVALTAKAVTDLGIALTTTPLNEDQARQVCRDVILYTQRVSDNTIRMLDFTRAVFSNYA